MTGADDTLREPFQIASAPPLTENPRRTNPMVKVCCDIAVTRWFPLYLPTFVTILVTPWWVKP